MKHLVTWLMVLTAAYRAASQDTQPNITPPQGKDLLLVYVGNFSGMVNGTMGIHFELDSSIGFRYDFTLETGASVLTHTAFFYKFSDPTHIVMYNYRTHSSVVENRSGKASLLRVSVVGTATIDTFSCTHLQHNSDKGMSDYWMSRQVPGFSDLADMLTTISAGSPLTGIGAAIFNWGGLVRMTSDFADPRTGRTGHADLKLKEAATDLSLPSTDFDVPSN